MTAQSESLPVRSTRRRKKARPSSSPDQRPLQRVRSGVGVPGLRAGWRVIAAKEFTDEITSLRFLILTIVMTLAAAAAVYSTAGGLGGIASEVAGEPSVFLVLFTGHVGQIPPFTTFITFLGPLLGIAFGFDGVNGERSEGTLPRLLAQPIHRDDVVNGKFVAGLSAITVILISVVGIVAAIGVIQLGILPSAEDVLRLMVWVILTIAYIGFWLALALLCSVVFRRAATSALVALSVWLVMTVFLSLIIGILAGVLKPIPPDAGQGSSEARANLSLQVELRRIAPNQLYEEATAVVLDPRLRTVTPDLVTPAQRSGAIGGLLSLDQSVLVVWPQFVALIAVTAGAFALAYVSFMRQEVRA
ncbi:MAG: ABC transporter permease subunit [Chloroflexota bacterium]